MRHAAPTAGDPVALEPEPALPLPTRLPRRPATLPASLPSSRPAISGATTDLVIEVLDLPDGLPPGAGVAVFAADTGARFCWLPLASATIAGSKATFATATLAAPALRVTMAPSERAAQNGYWVATEVAGPRSGPAAITIQASVQRVRVHSGSVPGGYGQDVRLRRLDDPQWRPIDASTADFVPDRRGDLELLLGAGTYELVPWTAGPWQPVRVQVPGPGEVTAVFTRLPAVPGDRP